MLKLLLTLVTVSCFITNALSQPKTLSAVKAVQPPRIDGELDDIAWQASPVATDFIQNFPAYGQLSSARTEVRILYDDNAVYVCAYLHDDPSLIHRQLTARDGEQQQDVDYFSVFLDTYNDQQNGFQFLVTTANVQTDAKLTVGGNQGFGNFGDRTWDAVWESRTTMKKDGWTVEMKIPYISLRFSKKEVQTWGLQFLRFTRRNNESSYWNPVNPNINGFANQFGKWTDLKNIQPPLRLSFSPYLSTGFRVNPETSTSSHTQWLRSGGMDVKYGINESFTLDATLIPDFGQVISDNVVNNLSPFEIRFQENRPFFTEGTELFNKSGLFYSRRIGAVPGYYDSIQSFVFNNPAFEIVKNPSITQLYNGIKLSGRTKKKLGIGIFNALTAPMSAELFDVNTKRDTLIETEPTTNYNILVLDQALRGQSSVTFTNTNVIRRGNYRNANVSAFDWSLFSKGDIYQFQGTARYSKIFGYTPYTGSVNLVYDTVTIKDKVYVKPYGGFNTSASFGKVSGKLQYYASNIIISNDYDPNDLGYLQVPNQVNYNAGISYNQFTPTKRFITYAYRIDLAQRYLYKPYAYAETDINVSGFWVFKNFWDVTLSVNSLPYWQHDYFELHTPGRFVKKPAEVFYSISGSTDSRKRLFIGYFLGYAARPLPNDDYYRTQGSARYRFSNKFTLSLSVARQQENNQVGYAFLREGNGEPIIGHRKFIETISVLSGIYNFNPRLNLTLRTRHYWNKVHYNSFYDVDADGNHLPRNFIEGQDQNYNVFNLDAFFTWDFRLGSRIIVGWKNWLGDPYGADGIKYMNYVSNLGKTFDISHGNEFTVKVIYFLDYNQLKKRK